MPHQTIAVYSKHRSLIKAMSMQRNLDRLLSNIKLDRSDAAANELADYIFSQQGTLHIECVNALKARLQADEDTLKRLLQISAKNMSATMVVGLCLRSEDLHGPFIKAVRKSPQLSGLINAIVHDLSSEPNVTAIHECHALTQLAMNDSASARAAAKAGAINKLVQLLGHLVTCPFSADICLPQSALLLLHALLEGSGNRCTEAVRVGALPVLARYLAPSVPQDLQDIALVLAQAILNHKPAVKEPQVVQQVATALSGVLGRAEHSVMEQSSHVRSAEALFGLSGNEVLPERRARNIVGTELAKAGVATGLVGLARSLSQPATAIGLLSLLLSAQDVSDAQLWQQATAVVDSRGVQVLLDSMHRATGAQGSPGMGSLLLPVAQQMAAGTLQLLVRIRPDVEQLIGAGNWQAILASNQGAAAASTAATASVEQRAGACAKCGATSGSGKDGALLQCSRCRRAWYCGAACQRGHWKDHKAYCKTH